MSYRSLKQLPQAQMENLCNSPVGRLATADQLGMPHVIPVCFGVSNGGIFILLDQKPKRTKLTNLKRVRNILENPSVSMIVDHYDSDWTNLWYILVSGVAELLYETPERPLVLDILKQKYPQYKSMGVYANPLIKITPKNVLSWSYSI